MYVISRRYFIYAGLIFMHLFLHCLGVVSTSVSISGTLFDRCNKYSQAEVIERLGYILDVAADNISVKFLGQSKGSQNCNCYQVLNGSVLCLPSVFIIGQGKSGSSSLYHYLMQDQRFLYSKAKELPYKAVPFNQEYCPEAKNKRVKMNNYLRNFMQKGSVSCNESNRCFLHLAGSASADINEIIEAKRQKDEIVSEALLQLVDQKPRRSAHEKAAHFITVDATVDYHVYADMPGGIHSYFPEARFIIIIRDPLERAISSYKYAGLGMDFKSSVNATKFLEICRQHILDIKTCRINFKDKESVRQNLILSSRFDRVKFNKREPHTTDRYIELWEKLSKVADPCYFGPFVNTAGRKRKSSHINFFVHAAVYSHLRWWSSIFKPNQFIAVDFKMLEAEDTRMTVVKDIIRFLNMGSLESASDSIGFNMKFSSPRLSHVLDSNISSELEKKKASIMYERIQKWNKGYIRRGKANPFKDVLKYFEEFDHNKQLDLVETLGIKTVRGFRHSKESMGTTNLESIIETDFKRTSS